MRAVEVFKVGEFFENIAGSFESLAYALLILFITIVVGIHALKHFSELNLERKIYNFLIAIVLISAWPVVLFAMKEFIDVFNGFLVFEVFNLDWSTHEGFRPWDQLIRAWEGMGTNVFTYPLKLLNLLALLGLVVSRQVIYGLFLVFFFFLSVLGPLIIAKTVFSDEVDGFVELLQETVVLLLWQTTYIIIIGILYAGQSAGPYIITNESNILLQSAKAFGIVILTFLIPTITRKYGNHLGTSVIPAGLHYLGVALTAGAVGRVAKSAGRAVHLGGVVQLGARLREHAGGFHRHFVTGPSEPGEDASEQNLERRTPRQLPELLPAAETPSNHEPSPPFKSAKVLTHEVASLEKTKGFKRREVIETEPQSKPAQDGSSREQRASMLPGLEKTTTESGMPTAREKEEARDGKLKQEDALESLRRKLRLMRGPVSSRKFRDMAKVGIDHNLIESSTRKDLESYKRMLWLFDFAFGDRYNFRGEIVDESKGSPTKGEYERIFKEKFGGDGK